MNCILEMHNITKYFPGVTALDDVSFSVIPGEVHCLIGANGAGKSTLMKVLSGACRQNSGEVMFDGECIDHLSTTARRNKGISVIYQELSLVNEMDVGENVFLNNYPKKRFGAVDWKKVYSDTQKLLDKLNLDISPTDKISSLNMGQRQLTEIMKALSCNSKLIVMDEPSATLSSAEFDILKKVIANLKSHGVSVIYISHHLEELFMVGDRVSVMRDGRLVACHRICDTDEKQIVDQMRGRISFDNASVDFASVSFGETVLELQHLSNKKVKDINMKLHKGEILGMYGLVGSGRTETMRTVFGCDRFDSGRIILHGKEFRPKSSYDAIRHGIGFIPENRKTQGLAGVLPVWENMTMVSMKKFCRGTLLDYGNIVRNCEYFMDKLDIKAPSVYAPVGSLSGGNQQKVIVSKWLSQDSDILIIDEPTQGIDVVARSEVHRIIQDLAMKGKSIIVISSRIDELITLCNKIFVMFDGHEVRTYCQSDFNAEAIADAAITGRACF